MIGNVESMLEQIHECAPVAEAGERVVGGFPSPSCLLGNPMGVIGDDDYCASGIVVRGATFKGNDRAVTWKRSSAVWPEVDAVGLPSMSLQDCSDIVLVKQASP